MAARLEIPLPEVVDLTTLSASDLDPLFVEEIEIWNGRFHWDFRPSADLLRKFVQIRSLSGFALLSSERQIVGYAYYVSEGRKGLIGDFYLRRDYAKSGDEGMLLGAVVQALMLIPGIRRIESQLMLLGGPFAQLPFNKFLVRHDRFFMEAERSAFLQLPSHTPEVKVTFYQWAERYAEEIAHLVAAAYRGHVDSEINDQYRTIPGARHFLTNIVKFPGCGTFSPTASTVAVDDRSGRVCGVCLASMVAPTSGHVTQLCVLPGIRGARLGYELLRQTLTRLADAGCQNVSLTVTSSNATAIRLYQSVGFVEKSRFPALVWEGF